MLSDPLLTRILLIDDDPGHLKAGREALSQMIGVTVEACKSGEEALRIVHRIAPDLILLDGHLSGLDSLAFVRRLRKMPAFGQTPVVLVAEQEEPEAIAEAHDPAILATIQKPYEPDRLNTVLRALWSFHHG